MPRYYTRTESALWIAISHLRYDIPRDDPRLLLADFLEEQGEREGMTRALRWAVWNGKHPCRNKDAIGWDWFEMDELRAKDPGASDLETSLFALILAERMGGWFVSSKTIDGAYAALAHGLTQLAQGVRCQGTTGAS